jgi:hypothetical protein
MAVAWVQRTATDTMGELTTYFHPSNLTNSLTKQDGKDVLWNSVLCAGAFAPGFAAASLTGRILNLINFFERVRLINYVMPISGLLKTSFLSPLHSAQTKPFGSTVSLPLVIL